MYLHNLPKLVYNGENPFSDSNSKPNTSPIKASLSKLFDFSSKGYGCLISSKDRRGELREFHFLSLMKVKQKMLLSSLQCLKEDECVSKICPTRKSCRKWKFITYFSYIWRVKLRFTIQETTSGDRNLERNNVVHKGEMQNLK